MVSILQSTKNFQNLSGLSYISVSTRRWIGRSIRQPVDSRHRAGRPSRNRPQRSRKTVQVSSDWSRHNVPPGRSFLAPLEVIQFAIGRVHALRRRAWLTCPTICPTSLGVLSQFLGVGKLAGENTTLPRWTNTFQSTAPPRNEVLKLLALEFSISITSKVISHHLLPSQWRNRFI